MGMEEATAWHVGLYSNCLMLLIQQYLRFFATVMELGPRGMAVAPWNNGRTVFFTDRHQRVLAYAASLCSGAEVTTVAGALAGAGGYKDGKPGEAQFHSPQGLLFLKD
eukprot:2986660-Amphidinium_carterae.1